MQGRHLRTNDTAGNATTGADDLVPLSFRDSGLDGTFMHPVLFQISLPAVVPRLFVIGALSLAFTIFGLAFLIRAKRAMAFSLIAVGVAVGLLIATNSSRLGTFELKGTAFGTSLALSIVLGWGLSLRAAKRLGLEEAWVLRCLGLTTLGALFGARLGYAVLCDQSQSSWRDAMHLEAGGLFGYGAYWGGLLGSVAFSADRKLAWRSWLDAVTPAALLATGLTRIGCYLQGCDFGRPLGANAPQVLKLVGTYQRWKPSPDGSFGGPPAWLQHVRDYGLSTDASVSLPTHPCQLYEAALAIVLGLLALRVGQSRTFAGSTFLTMVALFSSFRYALELLHADSDRGLSSATAAFRWQPWGSWTQLLAFGSVLVAVWLWRNWQEPNAAR